jgi:signal transduction histidine kinase/ligand-binding sensor domain-containing protein
MLAGPRAFALNPALELSQYAHKSWTISDGFFKAAINSIVQTPDGYLWLGTGFGLLRFDGVQSVGWTPPSGERFPSDNIKRLLVSRDGTLWIGTVEGLVSWKSGRLTSYPDLNGTVVGTLLEDRQGQVWAGAIGRPEGRLCAIRNGAAKCYGSDGSLGNGVLSLCEYNDSVWVGARTGLFRWTPGPPKLYPVEGILPEIRDCIRGDNGALWIAVRDGIRQLADVKIEAHPLAAGGQYAPSRLLRDRDGGLWIGTSGQGVVHVHQGKAEAFAASDGLSSNRVLGLFEDREGSIWVGTTDGLDRFRNFAIPTTSFRQGLSSPFVGSLLAARDGSIWLGTSDGLDRWTNGQITVYRKESSKLLSRPKVPSTVREINDPGLPHNAIESLLQDDRGRIWVSTLGGLAYFEDGRFVPVNSAPVQMVHSMVDASGGSIWINDQFLGLFHILDGKLADRIPWSKLGLKDYIKGIASDPARGGLWLGFSRGGLSYFKDGQILTTYTAKDGLGGGSVSDLRFESDGTLWAATEGGLSRLQNGRIATLTQRNGLPCDAVHWTLEDDSRSLWLYMPCGLVHITRAELATWTADPNHAIKATVLDGSDGVKTLEASGGFTFQAVKTGDGKLWFTTGEGVSVIDPRNLSFNGLVPPVHIEQITADRKTYWRNLSGDAPSGLHLPPLTRDLVIGYTALSLVAPEKVRFRYRLEGHDREWQDAGNRRQAFYNDLPPRDYRFRVQACNNNGVWNEAGASLGFSVDPAYYQARWFQALCFAAALALLGVIYRLRVLYLTRQFSIRMDERLGERMRLARDLHDTLLQSFQGVLMKLSAVPYVMRDRPEKAEEMLEGIIERARQAVAEGRTAVQGLRSSTQITNDLARAFGAIGEELAAGQNDQNRSEFEVQVEGKSRELPPLVRDETYRIGCEALRNAFQHASAKRIEVEIHYEKWQLRLRVQDNGKGIDPQVLGEGGRTGHHGLPGMHERARLVEGKLAVRSEIGSGTQIELTIPAAVAYAKSSVVGRSAAGGEST